jgi:hypothetical protein
MTRCSYLGLQEDPTTALDFPSDGNFCQHALPAAPPSPAHQKAFCLSEQHISCPVFLLAEKRPLPEDAAFINNKPIQPKNSVYQLPVVLLLLIVATLGSFFAITGRPSPARVLAESNALLESAPTFDVLTGSSLSANSSDSMTEPTGTLNSTRIACPPPAGWELYTVIPTDSIYRLGLIFGISVTELEKANCLENAILRPGDQIYVPSIPTRTPLPTSTPRPRYIPFYSPTPEEEEVKPNPPASVPPTAVPPTALPINTPIPAVPTSPPAVKPTDPPKEPTPIPAPTESKPDKPGKPTKKPKP